MSSKKHTSSIFKAAGFLAAFNHQLFSALEQKGISEEQLYELLKAENSTFINKVAEVFAGAVKVTTLAQMIAAAGFMPNRVSSYLTEHNFPLKKEGSYDTSGLGLYGGDREWSIIEIEAIIKPTRGRLEGLVRGLAYLKANPDALKDGPIVFPASSWVGLGGRIYIPYADFDDGELLLDLGRRDRIGRWNPRCRFLVSGKCA